MAWSRFLLARQSLVHVRDEKAQNTSGGSFSSGAWRTRTLNTVLVNELNGASLSSNQLTLPVGRYEIFARAPAYGVLRHQSRLYNVTTSALLIRGGTSYAGAAGDAAMTDSLVIGIFTLTGTSVVELQHQCQSTQANGFGLPGNLDTEVYAELILRRVG